MEREKSLSARFNYKGFVEVLSNEPKVYGMASDAKPVAGKGKSFGLSNLSVGPTDCPQQRKTVDRRCNILLETALFTTMMALREVAAGQVLTVATGYHPYRRMGLLVGWRIDQQG